MTQLKRLGVTVVFVAGVLASPQSGLTHGDVTPQAMETKGLLPLGEEWLSENPYRGNPLAASRSSDRDIQSKSLFVIHV